MDRRRRQVPRSHLTVSPVAYFDVGQLKRLALTGRAGCGRGDGEPLWDQLGCRQRLLFRIARGHLARPGRRRRSAGGDRGEDGQQYSGAQLLPDGETVLFTVYGGTVSPGQPNAMLAVQSIRGGQRRVVVQSGANGKPLMAIVYTVSNALFAVLLMRGRSNDRRRDF